MEKSNKVRTEKFSLDFAGKRSMLDLTRGFSDGSRLAGGFFFTTEPPEILFLSSKFVTGHDPTSYSNLEGISSINIFIIIIIF